jgi:ribosomal protein S18 acetylase RimI-like enzyme
MRPDEREQVAAVWRTRWGSERVVSRGRLHDPGDLEVLVAEHAGRVVGALAYEVRGDELECVTVDAFERGLGVGTALLEGATTEARRRRCRRLWLITTNDNTPALRFYQRRGLRLVALHSGGIDAARELKPEIPATGHDGIPIRDELELELRLDERSA